MIIMNIELDNIFGFNDFKLNFSYPKKIVNSNIKNEHLSDKPNFRYKKLNIILGSNATGKTTLGKAIMTIFNCINTKEFSKLIELKNNKNKDLKFLLDYINSYDTNFLYRIECCLNDLDDIKLKIFKSKISKSDSYERCIKKLKKISDDNLNYLENLSKINVEGWRFSFPESDSFNVMDINILNKVLKTLDNSVDKVIKVDESQARNAYSIKFKNRDVVIQSGIVSSDSTLSSGTKNGIYVASFITAIKENLNGFYYCDEKFSFINSEIENAILSLMVELLHDNTQLFFTTHNIETLDMDIPVHSFIFFNKKDKIYAINPEKFIKKNDISLKNAAQNQVFDFGPDLELLDELLREIKNEK